MTRRKLPACPSPDCQTARTTYVKHSKLTTKRRTQRRYRCRSCGRTFAANAGTPYHRMRHPPGKFDQVAAMAASGMPKAAIARTLNLSPSTISRWISKAAVYSEAFNDAKIHHLDPIEIQSDEIKGVAITKQKPLWAYTAIEVWSRLWITTRSGRRKYRSTLLHFRELKWRCRPTAHRPLISTDSFKYNAKVIARTFGPTCVHVQVDKRYKGGRVIRADRRLVLGSPDQLDEALARSEDSKTINTAYVERLNLTIRQSLAGFHRKTTAIFRSIEAMHGSLEILRCFYNFIRPHSSLRFGTETRTPAQQAGLVKNRMSWRQVFTARVLHSPLRGARGTIEPGQGRVPRMAVEW